MKEILNYTLQQNWNIMYEINNTAFACAMKELADHRINKKPQESSFVIKYDLKPK